MCKCTLNALWLERDWPHLEVVWRESGVNVQCEKIFSQQVERSLNSPSSCSLKLQVVATASKSSLKKTVTLKSIQLCKHHRNNLHIEIHYTNRIEITLISARCECNIHITNPDTHHMLKGIYRDFLSLRYCYNVWCWCSTWSKLQNLRWMYVKMFLPSSTSPSNWHQIVLQLPTKMAVRSVVSVAKVVPRTVRVIRSHLSHRVWAQTCTALFEKFI